MSRSTARFIAQLLLIVSISCVATGSASAAATEGVISTRPVCFPGGHGPLACNQQYLQGASPIRLANGDVVIVLDAGYGGGEAVMTLQYPAAAGTSPRWYPIYGTRNWGTDPSSDELQNAWPSALYFYGGWRIMSTLTNNIAGRSARNDVPTLTSQPTFIEKQWLKPNPPCEAYGSCDGASTGFDFAVTSAGGTVYDYHLDEGTSPTCAYSPELAPYTIGVVRSRINSDLTYVADGCITFPRPQNTYSPVAVNDISRGADGKYYMLTSHYPYQTSFQEYVSTDGLNFTYNNKSWSINCAGVAPDPNCGATLGACFTSEGAYLRDSSGLIADTNPTLAGEQRVIVGLVGNINHSSIDSTWRLYYWADDGAQLPATWGQEAASCPAPNIVLGDQSSYQGNFDGFTEDMLFAGGWAWDWYQPDTPVNVDVFVDNSFFTTLSASENRPDLKAPNLPPHYWYGNGLHGWTWPVTSWFRDGAQHTVDVRYSGTPTSQSNSPRTYKIATVLSVSLSQSPVQGGTNVTFTVNLTQPPPADGLTVLLSSSDPAAASIQPSVVFAGSGTQKQVTINTTASAGVRNSTIRASAGSVTKAASLQIDPVSPSYAGVFDSVTCDVITGWGANTLPAWVNTPTRVTIKDNGNVLISGLLANIFRSGTPGNGNHAFYYPVPTSTKDGTQHTITVQHWGSNTFIGTQLLTCARREQSEGVDVHAVTGLTNSNLNGVLEPGENVRVEPKWQNKATSSIVLTGTASAFGSTQPGTYTLSDTSASYGTIAANGGIADCHTATGSNCYRVSVGSGSRPVTHWDSTYLETLSSGEPKTWTLHIGGSFTDVSTSTSNPYYVGVETVLHKGITAGCTGTTYCPSTAVTRAQMAVFLVKAKYGQAFVPPPAIGIFADVPVGSFGADFVEQLYNDKVTAGCGGANYCPTATTTRAQMAVFLLKTKNGYLYSPPTACGCIFSDVQQGDFAADWIEALQTQANGVAPGTCLGSGKYCPNDSTTREQMATFITKTFGFVLYGP